MLTPPELSAETIIACLRDNFGLRIANVTFLPLGADVNAAVFRVDAEDGTPYFLKLRRGSFDERAIAVPFFLHERGIQAVMAPIMSATHRLWVSEHGFSWILYPFIESRTGYEVSLSDNQWIALGQSLRAVHTTILPSTLIDVCHVKRIPPNGATW